MYYLKQENNDLKQLVAELSLDLRRNKKKEKDIQELLKAKQTAHNYCRKHLQGVVDNLQKLRNQLKKPRYIYSVEVELIRNQILLEEIIKHLE